VYFTYKFLILLTDHDFLFRWYKMYRSSLFVWLYLVNYCNLSCVYGCIWWIIATYLACMAAFGKLLQLILGVWLYLVSYCNLSCVYGCIRWIIATYRACMAVLGELLQLVLCVWLYFVSWMHAQCAVSGIAPTPWSDLELYMYEYIIRFLC